MLPKLLKRKSKYDASAVTAIEALESRRLFTGLAAAYFGRSNLTGVKYAEVDGNINFSWVNTGTPKSSLGTDGFSTRWVGSVLPKFSEAYTFLARDSGGVRVWVNDTLIIDAAAQHGYESDSGKISLVGGQKYNIRVDYTSDGTAPQIQLLWASARTAKDLIPDSRFYASSLSTVAPDAPSRFRATFSSETTAKVMWTAATASNIVGYDVYVGSTKVATTLASQTYYTRSNLSADTNYTFSVQSVTAAGGLSKLITTAVTTAGNGNSAPGAPSNLSVGGATSSSLALSWSAARDDASGVTYRVYRNGTKLGVAPSATSFTDTGLTAGTSYSYQVRAVDAGGLVGDFSNSASGSTTGATSSRNAFSTVTAGSYDTASGVSKSGSNINSLDSGDYAVFENMAFDASGAKSISFNLAATTGVYDNGSTPAGEIDIHLDSTGGQLVGQMIIQPTGSSSTFNNERMNLSSTVTGTHNVYLVFRNRSNAATLGSFVFSTTHLTQVMALGDSLTQESGGETNHNNTWRYYLQQQLNNAGKNNYDFVGSQTQPWEGSFSQFNYDQNNEGHAGYRADEVANDVVGWASANVPDVVLLTIGTNDIKQGQSVSSTLDDIGRIIDNLRSVNPNVRIGLSELIPLSGFQSQIDQLNSGIVSMASSKNTNASRVTVVNNSNVSSGQQFDGIHPNDSGDQTIANNWYGYLSGILS